MWRQRRKGGNTILNKDSETSPRGTKRLVDKLRPLPTQGFGHYKAASASTFSFFLFFVLLFLLVVVLFFFIFILQLAHPS